MGINTKEGCHPMALSDDTLIETRETSQDTGSRVATAIFVVSYDDAVTTPQDIADAPDEYGYTGVILEDQASDS
jgi:hypothetical protein